jgi:hypothetical protein
MADPVDTGFWAWLASEPGKAALAGAAGGLVRWITLRDNWREGVPGIAVGAVCALYLGPLAEPLLRPFVGALAPSSDPAGFAAFVVGMGGIGITAGVIDVMQAWRHRHAPAPRETDRGDGDA